jgi:phosphodiesterase/alkaline phosphatase D-like protein
MNTLLSTLAVAVTSALLFSPPTTAQAPPPPKQAKRVHITQGPALESATNNSVIITWKSNNPGGTDEHFGVVRYGLDPKNLSETAKSHIRLNRAHTYTVFRVRVDGLKPKTTYYYKVDSASAGSSSSDGVISPVKTFMTE